MLQLNKIGIKYGILSILALGWFFGGVLQLFAQSATPTISYSTTSPTNQNVVATLRGATPTNGSPNLGEHIFTDNSSFGFTYQGANGQTLVLTATVTWIDKVAPTATVIYTPGSLTSGRVLALLTGFSETGVVVQGDNPYTFTESGSYVFSFTDRAGNKSTTNASVTWIDNIPPTAEVEYTQNPDGSVTAKLVRKSEPNTTVINNNGSDTYTFLPTNPNRTFVFELSDSVGNVSRITATNSFQNTTKPTATVVYSTTRITTGNVIATLTGIRPSTATVVNNGGSTSYSFTGNGRFTFLLRDASGATGEVIANVNNIQSSSRANPTTILPPDIVIDKIMLVGGLIQADGTMKVSQGSTTKIDFILKNIGQGDLILKQGETIPAGFITCEDANNVTPTIVYQSRPISNLIIKAGTTQIASNADLATGATQQPGVFTIKCTVNKNANVYFAVAEIKTDNNTQNFSFEVLEGQVGRFADSLRTSVNTVEKSLDIYTPTKQQDGIKDFIIRIGQRILIPLGIAISIITALLGFYTMMTGEKSDDSKKGVDYILRGVVGIIIMMSANYLATTIYGPDILSAGKLSAVNGTQLAQNIYSLLVYPFLKLAIYIVLGILFIVLLIHAFRFITDPKDDITQQSKTIIIWNTVGMLTIIGAKTLVEAIYGRQEEVVRKVTNISEIGTGLLQNKNIPLLFDIINWAMGLISLIVLVIIIIQTFELLTKPDDDKQLSKIKQNFIYIFFGVMLIGAGYLVTNFFIIN